MLQDERHHRIRSLLEAHGFLTATRIARELSVSRETVRRDVLALEEAGELRRVHGGVVSVEPSAEPPIAERVQARQREKRRIARAAAGLVKPGQTLLIDAGSTVTILAEELAPLADLTIITNSFAVAACFEAAAGNGHQALLLGGRLNVELGASYGVHTLAQIRRFRADWAFLSPVAVHPADGVMSFDLDEVEVARAMSAASARTCWLADHSKIGQRSRMRIAAIEDVDTLITDAKAEKQSGFAALKDAVDGLTLA